MAERKSRSDRARDFEQAFEEMQHGFEVAVARLRPALISISKNVTRIRSRIGALQGVHRGLVSLGAYMRDHRSEIEALLGLVDETHRNVENAKLMPEDHPQRKLWEKIGKLPLGRYVEELPYLPYYKKPRARPGRRRGVGPVVSDDTLLAELHVLVMGGMKPTTAAIALLRKRGVPPEFHKSRADHVVKLYRASDPKAQKTSPNKKHGKN
ncbi:hypothetical protein [Sinorhizobium sp. CCBAU 05631]|uniref:hypothetical protein n=1 Tax=Sinorhizobium sp. CCBAU 05631 TaxID=794846 RepID=UPI000BACB5BB|nr:hypothetical protein [Sinorhizobium sp. CCBAU 05631]